MNDLTAAASKPAMFQSYSMFPRSLRRRLQGWVLLFRVLIATSAGINALAADAPDVPLALSTNGLHDVTVKDLGAGAYELQTTGGDPFVMTLPLTQVFDPKRQHVLSFEYFSTTGIDHFQVFTLPPGDEEHSV